MQVVTVLLVVTLSYALAFSTCSAIGSECIDTKILYTITVSQSNKSGHFIRVQDAINAIPSNNRRWIRVLVNPGTYIEQVQIPRDKQCVILQGSGPRNTIISFDAHDATDTSATFSSSADNFMANNIAFENTYDSENGTNWKQAVAVRVYGDKSAFYRCHFMGVQDTVFDVLGRHYFKCCFIQGAVDFIWGSAQSVYEDCKIKVVGIITRAGIYGGYITAQGRQGARDPSGFVFIRGKVIGSGRTYLGRAYGVYARVIFQQTYFGRVVVPLGWDAWHALHHEGNVMYVEDKCSGPGADLSHRVGWMRRVTSAAELSNYTVSAFIDQDGWISKQPT